MSRKRNLLIGFVLAPFACALVFALDLMLNAEPIVNKANFDRVRLGMSREEVRGILGGSSDHFFPGDGRGAMWEGADGNAYVLFGMDGVGTVSKIDWIESDRTPEQEVEWEREQIAIGGARRMSVLNVRLRRFLDSLAFWK